MNQRRHSLDHTTIDDLWGTGKLYPYHHSRLLVSLISISINGIDSVAVLIDAVVVDLWGASAMLASVSSQSSGPFSIAIDVVVSTRTVPRCHSEVSVAPG